MKKLSEQVINLKSGDTSLKTVPLKEIDTLLYQFQQGYLDDPLKEVSDLLGIPADLAHVSAIVKAVEQFKGDITRKLLEEAGVPQAPEGFAQAPQGLPQPDANPPPPGSPLGVVSLPKPPEAQPVSDRPAKADGGLAALICIVAHTVRAAINPKYADFLERAYESAPNRPQFDLAYRVALLVQHLQNPAMHREWADAIYREAGFIT